ncbi:Subtilase family protein [Halogranum amylolyticum]|uniref:Subtilase family protein n=1 Tax=Halogranum amylolyticum TaxID=660520 RepID=A0A1H8SQ85_9EURY|nr:S8 family serine peptidase [Halogranum amylolyticum]SEO80862.1 Subtilase family protein [Halogranum amylolyticum]
MDDGEANQGWAGVSQRPRRVAVHVVLALLFASTFAAPALTQSSMPGDATLGGPSQYDDLLVMQRGAIQASIEARTTVDDPRESIAGLHSEGSRGTDGVRAIRADELHRRGITGEDVKVGVVGSAFDADNAAIADRVAGHYRADEGRRTTQTAHDTAVAEVVTRTTPDAALYLAGVGDSPTPRSYADAVDWLVEQDVDVIVDSGSYFAPTTGEMNRISAAAERASDRGVVFVTSAGNYANRHWAGVADGEEWVSFAPDSESNALAGGDVTSGRVSLNLYWNSSADYDLYLYRKTPGEDPVVAKSTTRQDGENASSVETVDAVVPKGVYYVGVYTHEDAADETQLRLFSSHHSLTYTTAAGSMVAPATSERVITVGALDAKSGHVRAYSSQDRTGTLPDVTAPDGVETTAAGTFYGTSAAAPYVAGSAALVKSRDGELSPKQVEQLLEATARETEHGRQIDALAAVEAASSENVTARVGHGS